MVKKISDILDLEKKMSSSKTGESVGRFRDSSAQNHFGPGLPGPDFSAHFSIRDCSAHFSGTARPIFFYLFFFIFYFFFLGGGGEFIVLFCLSASK